MSEPTTIEHDKREFEKVAGTVDRDRMRAKLGREPKPADFWAIVIPAAIMSIGIFLYRHWL